MHISTSSLRIMTPLPPRSSRCADSLRRSRFAWNCSPEERLLLSGTTRQSCLPGELTIVDRLAVLLAVPRSVRPRQGRTTGPATCTRIGLAIHHYARPAFTERCHVRRSMNQCGAAEQHLPSSDRTAWRSCSCLPSLNPGSRIFSNLQFGNSMLLEPGSELSLEFEPRVRA